MTVLRASAGKISEEETREFAYLPTAPWENFYSKTSYLEFEVKVKTSKGSVFQKDRYYIWIDRYILSE